MALPIFVGHQIVLPAKNLLENLGVSNLVAVAIPVGVFVAALSVGYLRLMRFLAR
jgi:hypothetical protein